MQASLDVLFGQPFDAAAVIILKNRVDTTRTHQLNRTRTVLSDCGQQAKGIGAGDLKFRAPLGENVPVVRQYSTQPRIDHVMAVRVPIKRHLQGQGVGAIPGQPAGVVNEPQSASSVTGTPAAAMNFAHDPVIGDHNQRVAHGINPV